MTPERPFRVRRALPEEADAVASLAARTFTDAFGADNHPDDLHLHLAEHCGPATLRRQLADPEWTTLVGEQAGEMCGYAQLCDATPPARWTTERGRQLYRFYVERVWWGSGLAQPLLAAAVDEARARGARHLWLTTWSQNRRALAFYRKSGFEEVGTTTFTVGRDRQHDLVLSRPLE
jgi:ribosomal protein S18 acetylase RimI-like enzyme